MKIIKILLVLMEVALFGCAVTFAVEWIVKGDAQLALEWCFSAPASFCLTALLYGGACLFLGLLTSQLWIGALLVSTFGVLVALVSYFKMSINGTPLETEDFGMVGQLDQVMQVAGDLTIPQFAWQAVGMLAGLTLVFLLLYKVLPLGTMRTRFILLTAELALMLVFAIGPGAVWMGKAFQVNMQDSMMASIAYRDYGLSLGLWRDCFVLTGKEPEGYSASYMEDVVRQLDAILEKSDALSGFDLEDGAREDTNKGADLIDPDPEWVASNLSMVGGASNSGGGAAGLGGKGVDAKRTQPNVIFILSESFFDMNRLPGLSLSADPAENFHRLQKEGVSGKFYTSYLGYGTGYIEQSIFTGLTGKDLKSGTNICFRSDAEYSLLDSVATPFKNSGYETEMLHAYNNTLYNRMVTYPRMGFKQLLFSPEIQALDLNIQGSPYAGGYYLSDSVFMDALLNRMDAANDMGKPAFLFGITMENHQPFDPEKFGYKCQIDVASDMLDEDNLAIVRVMTEGITRADQALGELTDALRQREEPTVVVFFGDHRPNLFMTDGDTVYSHLGLCNGNDCADWDIHQVADIYSTDYLIWANDAALLGRKAGTVQDAGIGSIGSMVLDVAGMPKTRYWRMQERLSQSLLINTELYCVTADGTPSWTTAAADLTGEDRELLLLRSAVIYDTYYGQRYVTGKMNQILDGV